MNEFTITPDWFDDWFDNTFKHEFITPAILIKIGFKKDQIYRAAGDGSLEAFKPNGRWYIPRPALRIWLLQNYSLNF